MVQTKRKFSGAVITSLQQFAIKYLAPRDVADELENISTAFDEKYGTETGGHETIVTSKDRFQYFPMPLDLGQHLFSNMEINYEEYTMVDVGSGKGRLALIASLFPFKKVLGVEIMPEFHELALVNGKIFKDKNKNAKDVEFTCDNALDFVANMKLENNTLFFLFHPFGGDVLKKFLNEVRRLDENSEYRALIVYCGGVGANFAGFNKYMPIMKSHSKHVQTKLVGKSPLLTREDIKDIKKIMPKGIQRLSKSGVYLWNEFPDEIKSAVKNTNGKDQNIDKIIDYLNGLLKDVTFYDRVREQGVLMNSLQKWGADVAADKDKVTVNRLVFNEAFSRAIKFYLSIPMAAFDY